jgi:hypothetical protein
MHINVTIGLLGFLGGAIEAIRGYLHSKSAGIAFTSKVTMAGLLLVYVILCVQSFIVARRSGRV